MRYACWVVCLRTNVLVAFFWLIYLQLHTVLGHFSSEHSLASSRRRASKSMGFVR